MKPFAYHHGRREVRREANSMACADTLLMWVGPVSDFARIACLIVLASHTHATSRIAALSGTPRLLSMTAAARALTVPLTPELLRAFPDGGRGLLLAE